MKLICILTDLINVRVVKYNCTGMVSRMLQDDVIFSGAESCQISKRERETDLSRRSTDQSVAAGLGDVTYSSTHHQLIAARPDAFKVFLLSLPQAAEVSGHNTQHNW